MKKYAKGTPQGSRDLLFEECDDRKKIETTLSDLYKERNYRKVITPAIEYIDVFENDSGMESDIMYKLTDAYGRTTVLRPDNTMPIARLVATRLRSEDFPVRLYYNQNVFARNKAYAGRTDEIPQSGIELIGDGSVGADLEVLSMAFDALDRSELNSYSLEIGHAGFFNAILDDMDIDASQKAEICSLTESKNFAALSDLLSSIGDTVQTRVLNTLPRLFGGREVLKQAKQLYSSEKSDAALDYLGNIYQKLCEMGHGDNVLIDLGLVNRTNYYTGVIFRGYAEGSGVSVLSGGRYDNLIGKFGLDAPAIGFAVDINALFDVMHEVINVERPLRIALTKGRLEKSSVKLFQKMGLDTSQLENKGRRLILPVDGYEAVLSKAPDVITYVEHGVCDIGIVGKDTIVEHGSSFYEVLDLNIGKCRFALACPKGKDFFSGYSRKTVASKYPKVAKEFFQSKGMDVDIIKIEGSVELAPLLGLADGIVDIVETGSTLKENGLEVVEEILPISARVIVNMASMKLRKQEIECFLSDLELASKV